MKKEYIYAESIEEFYDLVENDLLEMRDLSYSWSGTSKMYSNGTQLYRGNVWWSGDSKGRCKVSIFKVVEENVYSKEMFL